MKVLSGNPLDWNAAPDHGSVVSIGVFDGVHRGHQEVLADLSDQATALGGLQKVVLTFDPHPLAILTPAHAPPLIGSLTQRLDWLEAEGIDMVGVLPFAQIRTMAAKDFVEEVLVKGFASKAVVVGMDFRYGLGRDGNVDTLAEAGDQLGFVVDGVPLLTEHDGPLSSSNVRILVQQGHVEAAAEVLGRYFAVRGDVVAGDGRGKTIGVPTANLEYAPEVVLPRRGVYATWASFGDECYRSVTNVGVRPTFDGNRETVEAHLFELDRDIYGEAVDLHFVAGLREEQRFAGVDDLVKQIHEDIENAGRALEGAHGPYLG